MRRSVLALVGCLVGIAYLALVTFALARIWDFGAFSIRALGFDVHIARLLPFLVIAGLANVAGWIGFISNNRIFLLAAALLYGSASVVLPVLVYATAALAVFSLAVFLFHPMLTKKREKPESEAASDAPDEPPEDIPDALLSDDPSLSLDTEALPEDAPEPDESEEDTELQDESESEGESPLWLDEEEEVEGTPAERSPSDGTGVFLGVFMALAALVLVGVVVYGLMMGKLPFMP